jgi:CheY-like chemotaxis protein
MSPKIVVFSPTTFFLHSIVNILTGNGFQITPIKQHPSSLQEIEQLQPDVLIVDNETVFSPSVLEIVQALKTDTQLASIPVICTTSVEKQNELSHLAGVAVFTPPINSTSLLEWVRQMLGASAGKSL